MDAKRGCIMINIWITRNAETSLIEMSLVS